MKTTVIFIFLTTLLAACAVQQRYYAKSNLNQISLGNTKQQLLSKFPGSNHRGAPPPMRIRAAQKNNDKLIEVGEVIMSDGITATTIWFLFENGVLVQWGQPEDWKDVKARYEISYNPSTGVTN